MARREFREISDLSRLREIMAKQGAEKLFVKKLSPNDNSKNQVYLGDSFEALNIIPNKGIYVDEGRKGSVRDRFKAGINLLWVDADGKVYPAPSAQLVMYPKYPEVRMSGFLLGCKNAPSEMMQSRREGRLLFLGIRNNGTILGHVTAPSNPLRRQIEALRSIEQAGVFLEVPLERIGAGDARHSLLISLRDIYLAGWIDSVRLKGDGSMVPCRASNCGGYTLEARLGVRPNGYSEPDFLGWEVKQHGVETFERPDSGSPVTLMTPEPTGGIYQEKGVEYFIRKFGYPDKTGKPDRMNFGGVYKYGRVVVSTGLVLKLKGYDSITGKITDAGGGLILMGPRGEETAIWNFADMMKHWNRKHAKAAYIPSLCRKDPHRQYRYGNLVGLGTGTDFLRFLKAVASGSVYYDPGIKLENASSTRPVIKRRSQFRIKPADLGALYDRMDLIDVNTIES